MKSMMQTLQKNRKNNKGFTLVELIIVIAIVAVLAAVLAPQYIKYVEKSRYATDLNAMNEIAHAMEVVIIGDGTTVPVGNAIDVTVTGVSDYTAVNASDTILAKVAEVCPEGSYTFVSNAFKTHGSAIRVSVSSTTGRATFTAPTAP